MTYNNKHPLANPFNQHRNLPSFSINKDPKKLVVPNQDVPLYGSKEWNDRYAQSKSLTVPNQDVPPGDQLTGNGFIGNSSLFRTSDGTILDFKSRKIVRTPRKENNEYWGDPNRTISYDSPSYHDSRSIEQFNDLISNQNIKSFGALDEIDPASAAYWLQAEEEAQKMIGSMTAEQTKLINDFERHFPKSRLIEESKKCK